MGKADDGGANYSSFLIFYIGEEKKTPVESGVFEDFITGFIPSLLASR